MLNVPITLTENAGAKIKELTAQQEGAIGVKLSIMQGKGCGGNEYVMEHIMTEEEGLDKILIDSDLALYIPTQDSFMMFGMVIDYGRDQIGNEQFIFVNPNERSRCGCGSSFELDEDKLAASRES